MELVLMLFNRHKHLLMLLKILGGSMENRDFQKLLFIYNMEYANIPYHQFVPYKYGGFSFTSYADRRKLVKEGYLKDDDNWWKLTKKANTLEFCDQETMGKMMRFNRTTKLRGRDLIVDTYRRYPYYATRSEIVHELGLDSTELHNIKSASLQHLESGLFTIGYEGHSLEDYMNVLIRAGITVLCDVRRNPLSRKYGFSKGVLSSTCQSLSIRYEHLPKLGIASDRRKELNSKNDYKELFNAYKHNTLPLQGESLEIIRSWVQDGERVALTCFEHEAEMCHRHCVSEALTCLDEELSVVKHL